MGVATSQRPAKSKTQQMEQTQCKVAWQCALSVSEVMPSRNPAAEQELQPAECLLALATHLCSGIVSMYAYHMIPYVHIFMYILYCTYISLCMILFAGIGICFIFSLCEEKLQWKLQTAWLRDRVTDYSLAPSRRLTKATNSAGSLDATTATYEKWGHRGHQGPKIRHWIQTWPFHEHGIPAAYLVVVFKYSTI